MFCSLAELSLSHNMLCLYNVQAMNISGMNSGVNCSDFNSVTNFSFSQYDSMRAQALVDRSPNVFTVSEAHSVFQLLSGLKPTFESSYTGKDMWVQAFIPENLHAPICNDATRLYCSCTS